MIIIYEIHFVLDKVSRNWLLPRKKDHLVRFGTELKILTIRLFVLVILYFKKLLMYFNYFGSFDFSIRYLSYWAEKEGFFFYESQFQENQGKKVKVRIYHLHFLSKENPFISSTHNDLWVCNILRILQILRSTVVFEIIIRWLNSFLREADCVLKQMANFSERSFRVLPLGASINHRNIATYKCLLLASLHHSTNQPPSSHRTVNVKFTEM